MSVITVLEFEAAITQACNEHAFPRITAARLDLVAQALREAGLRARICQRSAICDSSNHTRWSVVQVIRTLEDNPQPNTSETSPPTSRFGALLITPIFRVSTNALWRNDVRTAMQAISACPKWKARCTSTGFHIYVGPADPESGNPVQFSVPQLQKLAMFNCRFEAALDMLCPAHYGVDNGTIHSNRWNDVLKYLTLKDIYIVISQANSIADIVSIMNHGTPYGGYPESKEFKVNYYTVYGSRTVGFGQHKGTTNAEMIITWVDFVSRFVSFAISASFDEVMRSGDTIEDLGRIIELPVYAV